MTAALAVVLLACNPLTPESQPAPDEGVELVPVADDTGEVRGEIPVEAIDRIAIEGGREPVMDDDTQTGWWTQEGFEELDDE